MSIRLHMTLKLRDPRQEKMQGIIFVAVALIACANATAMIAYSYVNLNCTGDPTSAFATALGVCLSTPTFSVKIIIEGNTATTSSYTSPGCSGAALNSTATLNSCNEGSVYTTGTSFRPAPGSNDRVVQKYYTSSPCSGAPGIAQINYGSRCTNLYDCISSSNEQYLSTIAVCGNNSTFPNSAASMAAALSVLAAALLVSF